MKGMMVSVYRDASGPDCSCNGISARFHTLTLVGEGVPEQFEPDDCKPGVKLVRRQVYGREYISAVPVDAEGDGTGRYMFGGNFIYACDSRFLVINRGPIPVHDRDACRERR